ncbi:type ISP restriction/modification enzyme [Marinomonas sp. THO17]|uniref:DEAD/DEAH box helicase n=1 Tax=Marinomonas sp. THO17 TaxID=3149048 RepID=UPI00336C2428
MTPLQNILERYRSVSQSEREKGTYFEELIVTYLKHEATYKELYSHVWLYADWAKEQGIDGRDIGIDLVAKTQGTDEYHAIQCKCYATDYRVQKRDIDSFFTASGKKPFARRVIVTTSNNWSEHADDALRDQQPPVTKIDLNDLENSQIDWSLYQPNQTPVLKTKKSLRDHQIRALNAVEKGLLTAERGKLIMACGTGKTFTSLKIAEQLVGKGKRVLFLVPSLSLLSQTLTEWTQESQTPLHSFAVCSDSEVGKKRKKDDDAVNTYAHELRFPATTNHESLAKAMEKRHDEQHMSVVFSTYHSIDVINKAQTLSGLADFDLIICDEAHRTTGATFVGDDESNFVKVHDQDFIKSQKRLYMTATPRIYHDLAKAKAEQEDAVLCSMDDPALYGKELFTINFSEAVQRGLLCDYKVIVLTVSQDHISSRLQSLLKDEDNQLKVDDAAKIIGCWKALSKQNEEESDDLEPMRRAVAFCQVIEPASTNSKSTTHKVSSKNIADMFEDVVEAYQAQDEAHHTLKCQAEHVDGSMNASEKEAKLNWLKEASPDNTCRILSNVRCLSEGVDVPALDAVLFLTPRNSQVDVVQSVGRVMRNAPGKERGYVILPVVIPSGMEPHKALDDNKTYKVVWEVLQALRSHDDRFDAMINKLDLIGQDHSKMEVIAITDQINKKSDGKKDNKNTGKGEYRIGEKVASYDVEGQMTDQHGLQFEVGEIEKALYAKVVKKCGNRNYWTEWAKDISDIATRHISRITAIVSDTNNTNEVAAFTAFADELRDDLNDSITNDEVIEMLAQHLITKPVFDALFKEHSFANNNPVSLAMQQVLDLLQEHNIDKEADTLEKFYASVKMRAEGIDNAQGKQKIVVELYDKFFRNAFPKMTERLGIVYTPVEVVDFIIHSIDDLLKQEFGQSLGSEGVHIIDPFTGTGTFVTRLLQSGLISKEQLPHKYQHEIHANELVLLAYYIAAVNIEAVYHSLVGGEYQPFEGICLTDTFQLYEKDDLVSELLADNSDRRNRQKNLDIRVIMGNPPYSAGQTNANDNNANIAYKGLDNRIRDTYAAHSSATNKNALYDSYIRAIRWASDRVGNSGIIGFVTNAGFLEANTAGGLRKCLAEEFSSIYVFHLRGNARTSGEIRRKEKDNVFGQGTRTPIAMTFLVKNPAAMTNSKIHWHDIGDYLTQQQKLDKIADFASLKGITQANAWSELIPDEHHDWVGQRDDSFENFIKIGDKSSSQDKKSIFENYSRGVATARDAWCFNSSYLKLHENMYTLVSFYNSEVERLIKYNDLKEKIDDLINFDPSKISWNRGLKNDLIRKKELPFNRFLIYKSLYRPFTAQWLYFDKNFNDMTYQMKKFYPLAESENFIIYLSGSGNGGKAFSAMLSKDVPDLNMQHSGGQGFPLYLYEKVEDDTIDFGDSGDLFAAKPEAISEDGYTRKDGISDAGLAHFQQAYPNETLSKEDIFYYVYGLLHSQDYRDRYADNLSKELPRIPCVKTAKDFWHFSQAGRDLAELHINYETVTPYPVTLDCGKRTIKQLSNEDFRVTKMKLAKKGEKHTIIYNHAITVRDIPVEAYDYVVNGKAAIEWVMDRQCVKTDKASGIVNDANDWAIETMNNPKYPLELLQRVITVSLETMKIVNNLPALDID